MLDAIFSGNRKLEMLWYNISISGKIRLEKTGPYRIEMDTDFLVNMSGAKATYIHTDIIFGCRRQLRKIKGANDMRKANEFGRTRTRKEDQYTSGANLKHSKRHTTCVLVYLNRNSQNIRRSCGKSENDPI